MRRDQVILVDEIDNEIGTEDKLVAHITGKLHRAFSVFIFNKTGDMLLQRRALDKYHSGGLWTNACCSHPLPGESTDNAALRRLQEELGLTIPLQKLFSVTYKSEVGRGLIEHEFDHVFVGEYSDTVNFNQDEIMEVCYISAEDLQQKVIDSPGVFTQWFLILFPQIIEWWNDK